MKIKKLYASTVCAVALMIGYNSAIFAMDADAEVRERISLTRSIAQKMGLPKPDEASITPEVGNGYAIAAKVFKFYKDVKSARPQALPDVEPAEWTRLAMDASRGAFSPLYETLLDHFTALEHFNTVDKTSFTGIVDGFDPSTAPKAYTPSVMADCLEAFINGTNRVYDLRAKQRILRAFLSQVNTDIPDQTQTDVRALHLPAAAVELPANRDRLREFLDSQRATLTSVMPIISYVALANKFLRTAHIDGQLALLTPERFEMLDHIAKHNTARLRDFMYATILEKTAGKLPTVREHALASLQANDTYQRLARLTDSVPLFQSHSDHGSTPMDGTLRYREATAALQADVNSLLGRLNSVVTVRDEADRALRETERSLQDVLIDMAHIYKDVEYAKTTH